MKTVGVVSDTHGLMRPEALASLRGSDLIVHAGDVGGRDVLRQLESVAPAVAVRGNVDVDPWGLTLPETEVVNVEGVTLYVLHDIASLDLDPGAAGFAAVIYGHSHQPLAERRKGVLYLNPGSAGPRRFKLPLGVALIRVHGADMDHELVELKP